MNGIAFSLYQISRPQTKPVSANILPQITTQLKVGIIRLSVVHAALASDLGVDVLRLGRDQHWLLLDLRLGNSELHLINQLPRRSILVRTGRYLTSLDLGHLLFPPRVAGSASRALGTSLQSPMRLGLLHSLLSAEDKADAPLLDMTVGFLMAWCFFPVKSQALY